MAVYHRTSPPTPVHYCMERGVRRKASLLCEEEKGNEGCLPQLLDAPYN